MGEPRQTHLGYARVITYVVATVSSAFTWAATWAWGPGSGFGAVLCLSGFVAWAWVVRHDEEA